VGLATAIALVVLAAPATPADAPYDELPEDRVLYVAPGQTLSGLVRRLYPDRPGEWPRIERWIVENNPHAFAGGDPASLRARVRVRLPHPSALAREQAGARDGNAQGPRLRFDDRYLFVDPAQSLRDLVPRLYPEVRSHWDEIVEAIRRENADVLGGTGPRATIGRGTRLRIPDVVTVRQPGRGVDSERPPPEPAVAEVVAAKGEVRARGRHGRERALSAGEPLRRHDHLSLGPDARAELRFRDGERVFLRPGTELRVRAWRLPDVGPGARVLELVAGGLRAVTGAIGNRAADDYRTVTPNATMGVRGTRYALRLCDPGACRLGGPDAAAVPPGLYIGVGEGRVGVLNAAGEAEVAAGAYAFVAGPARAPEPADADVARVLYTEAERARLPEAAAVRDDADAEEDGPSWWWALGGLLLLGLAL
jgi:hypothetical protein